MREQPVRDTPASTTEQLERYAEPTRPPAPWIYPVFGVGLGVAIAVAGVVASLWAWGLLVVAALAGLGYDRWLHCRHEVLEVRDLPASVRRPHLAVIALTFVVVTVPLTIAVSADGVTTASATVVAGAAVALVAGVGGPIVDRVTRRRASGLVERRRVEGP